jgi:U3 small nucleolar RNA-associated protein 22
VEVENLFGTSEGSLPPLFIATPYDKQSSTWTRRAPSFLVLNRISDLSKEVMRILEFQLINGNCLYWEPIFLTPLSEYDCLIELKDSANPRRVQAVDLADDDESVPVVELQPVNKNYMMKMPVLSFDPVAEYLRELRVRLLSSWPLPLFIFLFFSFFTYVN